MQKINPQQFIDIIDPNIAYILGYLWADGYIHSAMSNKTSKYPSIFYKINLEIVSEDYNDISTIFNSIGKWAAQTRKRKVNWKETTTISTNSKDIYEFLYDNDYNDKSTAEPYKILSKLPENLIHYFWRGYFDGDGSISFGGTARHRYKSLQFSAPFGFKWGCLQEVFKSIGVQHFNISDNISKQNHRNSKISIQNIIDIRRMIEFLSKSELGLTRKTIKMNAFLTRFPRNY